MRITINTQTKADEEDIFKAGTLVVSKLDNLVIIVTEDKPYAGDRFCGTTLTVTKQHTFCWRVSKRLGEELLCQIHWQYLVGAGIIAKAILSFTTF